MSGETKAMWMCAAAVLSAVCAGTAIAGGVGAAPDAAGTRSLDPLVPVVYRSVGIEKTVENIRRIRETTGLRRFFLCGPDTEVMYEPVPEGLYESMGRDLAAVRKGLAGTDVELGWWISPTIRYVSDFTPVVNAEGRLSTDSKKCPLDPAFAADFAAKVRAVAQYRPAIINIEDDYSLAWSWGLGQSGACFCPRHLKAFAARYGRELTAAEIIAAFRAPAPGNLSLRRTFADTVRDSLVALARQVRAAVDEVDPDIRIMLCQPGGCDKDGDSTEALARAFAGRTRPAVRPFGAIYGAETTPAEIPRAIAHAVWTLEHLPKDIETFYEADSYPHNRFYSAAAQLLSMMSGALSAGSDDFQFYCLQYLDDPLEDRGYVDLYAKFRPRFEAVRRFIRERGARLAGVRQVWTPDEVALTRGFGEGHGIDTLAGQAYALAKFGIPYTTRSDATGPALLVAGTADVLGDDEIRRLLSGGLLVDAQAAAILARRGFGAQLGVDVEEIERLPALGEEVLPAAGCTRPGRLMNAYYLQPVGAGAKISRFVRLTPREGTEVLSRFTGFWDRPLMPSVTYAENALGGRVAVMATALVGNRSSSLYNLRKQELVQRLFARLNGGDLPVVADNVPGIWLLANVSSDGREMLLTVDNLSGDVRENVGFRIGAGWRGAAVSRLREDGAEEPLGRAGSTWHAPVALGSMLPEYFILRRK